ncbi:ribonuclease E activity regulator RraA [Laribacter hongkongensis]|uniref:ribonuclease E activity regulator RraA n=1 Tax=Laribacter hongkongensis TaxID=168471 RepID=UPI001EFD078E|nr:ribonuclease E activity regulator RraA [Laribacter hongkongensis]MCG9030705.1 ribonuclease E activity regulator RraA [Laribacter hongkongensis]MCG9090932.1 ribonuclease E activity regulator RraA [Laribacter hongkongensis]MCG9094218.1 ribonuclease E activity regulator RraA [Laribacter hongkongensis]MCG9097220.1 ribonuclease E activity regulator RraA [Laribacter hongkongensis]MCG9106070.1 ribonuclease E activity regulator RraA [Laribacter hongkongensis]
MDFLTADLCDEFSDRLQILAPGYASFGGHTRFAGRIATLKVFEDNSRVREMLSEPGEGRVLVVDGGGSRRCALVGDQLGALAVRNGWAGIVVYGCIRDSVALGLLPLGVRALATHPLKSVKNGVGERELAVTFDGATFRPGDWLYADEDGVITSPDPLL